MAAIDDGPVILPNGTKIVRENRATGQVYIVTGDADVRDALPSIDTVMQVLSTEIVEGRNLKVGIDELIVGARGVFKQRYMSQQGTQPEDAKAFTSLYTQAREWARQGCRAEVIDIACRRLNSVQFKAPLNSERVGRLIHEAISAGTAEMYGAFLENDLQSLVGDSVSGAGDSSHESMGVGERVCEYIKKEIAGDDLPSRTPDMEPVLTSWNSWKEEEGFVDVVAVDQPLYHPDGYAGTADAIIRVKGGSVRMLLWNDSGQLQDKFGVRVAACGRAWEYVSGQTVRSGVVVGVTGDGRFEVSPRVSMPRGVNLFKSILEFHAAHERMHLTWQSATDHTI